jgi:hypothetical protein
VQWVLACQSPLHISGLKPSACGRIIPAASGSLITFCKGFCALDEDDGILKCVECGRLV